MSDEDVPGEAMPGGDGEWREVAGWRHSAGICYTLGDLLITLTPSTAAAEMDDLRWTPMAEPAPCELPVPLGWLGIRLRFGPESGSASGA